MKSPDCLHRLSDYLDEISLCSSLKDLHDVKSRLFGKCGILTKAFKSLNDCSTKEERHSFSRSLNSLKKNLLVAINDRKEFLTTSQLKRHLLFDGRIPVSCSPKGTIHPVKKACDDAYNFFSSRNFIFCQAPEIEKRDFNFSYLNFQDNHPAQDTHDTFFITGYNDYVLRTHTSNSQVRFLSSKSVPGSFFTFGSVYRKDNDATHSPAFHQIEIFSVTEHATLLDLRSCIRDFLSFFFQRDIQIRFRVQHFPFTEPSEEVDIFINHSDQKRWIEVAGSGMIHRNVLRHSNVDSSKYQGFAMGIGMERLVMIRDYLSDLRSFFSGDLMWHDKYGIPPLTTLM